MTETKTYLEPFDYQEDDIQAFLDAGCRGFMTAETGAGKTLFGVEVGLRSGVDVVLVIGVRDTLADEWGGRLEAQSHGAETIRIIDGSESGKANLQALVRRERGWYAVTPQLFTRWGNEDEYGKEFVKKHIDPDLVILDEAHLLANRESKGGRLLRTRLRARQGRHIAMSGTMVRNEFDNFWNLSSWVYPDRTEPGDIADRSYQRWVTRWCETKYDPFAPGGRKILGELNPGEFALALPTYRQHFKRAHCCRFHPPRPGYPTGGFLDLEEPESIEFEVDLTPEQAHAIEMMSEHYVAWLTDAAEERRAIVAKLPIVAQIRLRQMALGMPSVEIVGQDSKGMPIYEVGFAPGCASPKLDLFEQRLLDTGASYLAMTSSRPFAGEVVRRLREQGYAAELWAGSVSKKERAAIKARFMDGETEVVVAVIESISTGIDGLQLATNRIFWFDRSRDITSNTQAEGRADRRGQTERVVNEFAIARGSMDRGIMSAQMRRRLALNKSLRRDLAREKKLARTAWPSGQNV